MMASNDKRAGVIRHIFMTLIMGFTATCFFIDGFAESFVIGEGDKTYIVDRTGERWDVTQAKSIGFKPEQFQYGIGRNTIIPLDDSYLSRDAGNIPHNLRVIGVTENSTERAYSVLKLSRHEIANTSIGERKIAVGY
jgi:hypothetical protein